MSTYALSAESQYLAFDDTSKGFADAMKPGTAYRFTATENCFVRVCATGDSAAAAAAGNILCMAGQTILLTHPYQGARRGEGSEAAGFVKVIRESVNGKATLTPMVAIAG